jgi:hypothetical protein
MDTKGTKENKAKEIIEATYQKFWNEIFRVQKLHSNKARMEKFEQYMAKKYVQDYFSRRVNPEVLPLLSDGVLQGQPFYKKIYNEKMNEYATGMAKKEGLIPQTKKFNNRVEKIKLSEKHRDKIKGYILDFFMKPQNLVENSNLFSRKGITFPRFIEIETTKGVKKKIKSYDETFSGTFETYGVGMSKYLSTLKYFPEFTSIGRKFGDIGVKQNI